MEMLRFLKAILSTAAILVSRIRTCLFPLGQQSWRTLRLAAVIGCACAALSPLDTAQAAEGGSGVYAPGFVGPQAGLMPEPGTYFSYNLYYYNGDSTTDVSVSGEVPVPGTGLSLPAQLIGSIDAEVESYAHLFTLTHVFEQTVLGGNVGLAVMLPYVDADLDLSGSGVLTLTGPGGQYSLDIPLSGEASESGNGVGDMTVTGLLGWHNGRLHYMAMLNVYAPTGKYDEEQAVNMGKNHWAIEPMGALTYLNEKIGLELSGAAGITFNMKNPDTEYTSGDELHLDLAAIQHFSEKLYLGLVGYAYNQLTGDRGSGASEDYKGRVYAWGGVIGTSVPLGEKHKLFINGRYYDEFQAKNRLEGNACYLTGAVNF